MPATPVISPVLRRTFMRIKPDYFALPIYEQERYRVDMPEADAFRLRQLLLKELFDIRVRTDADMSAALDTFSDEQHLEFNRALLPATGIGEDYFWLNEYMPRGQTLLDFDTLHDYDLDDHVFQEHARAEERPDHAPKPYRGSLYYGWARLIIDGEFYYATLSMAAGQVYSALDEFGSEKLAVLMPHRYINGKDHGKREGRGRIFSQRLAAGGLEPQVEELQRRMTAYLAARYEALQTEFDGQARKAVYMEDRSGKIDPEMRFIFSDQTALQAVRFRHFMSDCRRLLADPAELNGCIRREQAAIGEYLESACRDILDNFDPKVTQFRRKRKIIVADGALDDLF